MTNSQNINESLKLPPSQKTVSVRGNRPWGAVCSLNCGVANQQTCVVTVGCRLIPLNAGDRSSFSTPGLHVTYNVTEMDFAVLFYLKSTTSVDFTEPDRHVCADKSELRLKWNAYWSLGESQSTYGMSALLLRSRV